MQINFQDLLSTGAHFGHVTRKWHPSYKPFILMEKNGIHIINLEETIQRLNKAIDFIQDVVRRNGEILFVGTKKQARDIVQQEADRCGMFYVVERWLGGTLTNFSTIKKSIKRLQLLEKEGSAIYENLTKKEIQQLNRERIKLSDQHRGIKDMRRLPDVLVVVDADYESTAIREANRLEIPIVAIVDSNTDPTPIDYPIPANDDSIRTIQLIISAITDAIISARGKEEEFEEKASEGTTEKVGAEKSLVDKAPRKEAAVKTTGSLGETQKKVAKSETVETPSTPESEKKTEDE
ncbi:MAG: 30S ribosomal protein S2 [FCB group bacterium]|nr:30S ribosomal protein S2 [FCB group bacterium]